MARKLTVAAAAAMTLALIGAPAAGAEGDGRVVRTDKGAVSGTVTSAYRMFGNIPFAAAPVGGNRWRDPQPVTPWRGVRDATKPAPVCAQAPLEIATVSAEWTCRQCGIRIVPGAPLRCVACGGTPALSKGDEILLERIEMEVVDVPAV